MILNLSLDSGSILVLTGFGPLDRIHRPVNSSGLQKGSVCDSNGINIDIHSFISNCASLKSSKMKIYWGTVNFQLSNEQLSLNRDIERIKQGDTARQAGSCALSLLFTWCVAFPRCLGISPGKFIVHPYDLAKAWRDRRQAPEIRCL